MVFQGHFGHPRVENAMGSCAAARSGTVRSTAAVAPMECRNRLRVSVDISRLQAGSGGFYFFAAAGDAATRVSGTGNFTAGRRARS